MLVVAGQTWVVVGVYMVVVTVSVGGVAGVLARVHRPYSSSLTNTIAVVTKSFLFQGETAAPTPGFLFTASAAHHAADDCSQRQLPTSLLLYICHTPSSAHPCTCNRSQAVLRQGAVPCTHLLSLTT